MWLVNGQRNGAIAPDDRGLAYGDGLFETIALRDGQFRFLEYHLQRLAHGCERLALPPPPAELRDELAAAAAGLTHGTAKIILTRGSGPRGYGPPPVPTPTRLVSVTATSPEGPAPWRRGIRVRLCRTRLGENPALAGLKTLNRLEQVIARAEWNGPEIAEGLMMTATEEVIGGTMSNLFWVSGNRLLTPSLDRCGVRGVMRRVLMEVAEAEGIRVEEARLWRRELASVRELFLCNSQRGIGPVLAVDDQPREPGAVTRQLLQALAERGVGECAAAC